MAVMVGANHHQTDALPAVWDAAIDRAECSRVVRCKLQTLLPRSSSAEWVAAPVTAIKLIDYEYAGINAVAFDIANHWCFMCSPAFPASVPVLVLCPCN